MLSMLRRVLAGPTASASVHDAASLMASGAILVDVREDAEWRSGRAKGAVHVRLADIQRVGAHALAMQGIRPQEGTPLLLICHGGMRSGLACQALADDAAFRAVNVKGGTIAWERAGLPMERD